MQHTNDLNDLRAALEFFTRSTDDTTCRRRDLRDLRRDVLAMTERVQNVIEGREAERLRGEKLAAIDAAMAGSDARPLADVAADTGMSEVEAAELANAAGFEIWTRSHVRQVVRSAK